MKKYYKSHSTRGLKGGPNYQEVTQEGFIVTKQGQYKYPGKKTRIPGNNITMKGVPYPVFAIPNVGIPTMMQSGQDYYFPDADYVDEIPMMQDGGFFDKYVVAPLTGRPLRDALRRRLYESVTPIGYDPLHAAKEFAAGKRLPFKWDNKMTSYQDFHKLDRWKDPKTGELGRIGQYVKEASDDAWNYMLNREQKYNTLYPSKYKPSISKGEDVEYMSFYRDDDIYNEAIKSGIFDKEIGDRVLVSDSGAGGFTLDDYTLSKGKDSRGNYISYQDKYDINPKLLGMGIPVSKMVGKGEYDLYGRMYYNPVTRERIYPETQITNLPETIRKRVQNVGIEQDDETIYTPFALPTATAIANKLQDGNGEYNFQIPGLRNRMQYDEQGNKLYGYKSFMPRNAFGFVTPTEIDPLSKTPRGLFGAASYRFPKTNISAEGRVFQSLSQLPNKGQYDPSITDVELFAKYSPKPGLSVQAGPKLTTVGLPQGQTIFDPGYVLETTQSFPKLNLEGTLGLRQSFNRGTGIKGGLKYMPRSGNTFLTGEIEFDPSVFQGKQTPRVQVSATQKLGVRNEERPRSFDEMKDGGAIAKKQLNSDLLKTYKNYINGVDESAEAVKAYDKLNRIFYKESKLNNMSAPNYIMTHIIPNA